MVKNLSLLTLLFSLNVILYSQDTVINYGAIPVIDYGNPTQYEIENITVSGVEFIQKEVLISMSGLSKGQKITLPSEDITKVVRKFWGQGLFSDVKVSIVKVEKGKVWLDIYLRERPRMSQLEIKGLKKGEIDDLKEKLSLKAGSQVTDDVINTVKRVIRQQYIEKGFLNVDVNIIQRPDTVHQGNLIQLEIKVNKNEKVKIEDINISGNIAYSDQRIRRVLKKTKKKDLNIFKGSKMIKKEYEEDKEKLIAFYNQNGYRDFKILSDSIARISDDRIILYLHVEEGPKYYFGDISWIGNTIYPSEFLSKELEIQKGDIFNQKRFDKRLIEDEDAVQSWYLDYGYLFSDIQPVETSIDNDTINFEMRIYEGKPATINKIIIQGNDVTNEHVIRRELRTNPGDLFSKQDIIRSVRELANLGHFDNEKITPEPIPDPDNGTVDIRYSLVEKSNNQFEISGGWGYNSLIGTIGLRFSNFSAKNLFNTRAWRPIPTGDGQTVSIRAQSNGKYYQSYNISFIEPWFGGKKPNSFSISFYHSKMSKFGYSSYYYPYFDNKDNGYMKISGASIGLGRRLSWPDDFFTMMNELSYQRYDLYNYYGYFLFGEGISNNISISTILGRNSIDNPIYTRRGSSFTLSLQLTPPYSLLSNKDYSKVPDKELYNWIEFHKWKFLADWYTTLAGKLVLYSRAHFGYKGFYNKDIGPSPFEGFDLGGDGLTGYSLYGYETIALRGYENSSLTPRINGQKSGNVYEKLTIELRYPFSLNPQATIFGLIFVEAGNAWYSIKDYNPFMIRRSAGVGIRAFLPMFGLLGVDWGYGFDEIPGLPDASEGQFHFTIGQQF